MSRARSGGIRILAVAVALVLAIGVLQPRLASAATAIQLNPTSGQAGVTVVNVTGSGFTNGDTVTVTFQGFGTVTTATATGVSGSIATQFTVPNGATPSFYTVTASDAHGHTASAQFQVVSGAATTLSISKSVTNSGNGFLTYTISYRNNGPGTATGVAINDTLQQGQTLNVASLPAGCTYSTGGNGLVTVTCVPNPTGTPGNLPASPGAGSSGTFSFSTSIDRAFTGTIYNTATISASNTGSATSNTTSVFIGPGTPNPGPTTLQKSVEDNNNGFFGGSVNANPGDVVTYDIAYINASTNTTSPSVTITDALQPGQTYLGPPYSSSNCTPIGGNTISCPIGNVPPNTRVDVFISASINTNIPGTTISNQAQASSGGSTISSNTTTVFVGSQPPPCTANNSCCVNGATNCCFNGTFNCTVTGNFILCGLVSAYTGSVVTVNNVTIRIVPGASVSGPVTVGSNECITFALNSSAQATALAVSSNLAGVGVVCGTYGGTNSAGAISVSGIAIPLAPTATFQTVVTPGGFFCFLLNGNGQAYAVLSGVPTSIQNAVGGGTSQVGEEKLL